MIVHALRISTAVVAAIGAVVARARNVWVLNAFPRVLARCIPILLAVVLISPGGSWAGTGGTEFNSAYTTITSWMQGDLGRLIAAALLLVGLIMGVVRQSIMAAVPAIACGLVATIAPTVIGAVVTASI